MKAHKFSSWKYQSVSLEVLYDWVSQDEFPIPLKELNVTSHRSNIPIGHLVFKEISAPRSTVNRFINYDSYDRRREALVWALIEVAWMSNYRFESMRRAVGKLRAFFAFVAEKKTWGESALIAQVEDYTNFLREKTRLNRADRNTGITTATAYANQTLVIEVVEHFLGAGKCNHIRRIKVNHHQKKPITPPTDDELALHLTHYTNLFVETSKRLMTFDQFPWLMPMSGKEYYVIPFRAHQTKLQSDDKQHFYNVGFDYETGKLRTFDEIEQVLKKLKNLPKRKLWLKAYHHESLTKRILEEANSSPMNQRRRFFANLAVRAYFNHFLVITGMNDSTAASIDLADTEIYKGERKFRAIKMRAGGRVVQFQIQNVFMKYFDSYLKFREWVLKETGAKTSKLFFELPQRTPNGIREMREDGHASQETRKIDPFSSLVPHITSRRYRVKKGQWIAQRSGVEMASFSLQHSPKTNVNHYSDTTQETVDAELTRYFDRLNEVSINNSYERETVAGRCESFNSPTEVTSNWESFRPDCETFHGCVFCEHFVVHAQEQDIRKLLSMRFIAEKYLDVTDKSEVYLELVSPFLERVDNTLKQISELGFSQLVSDTRVDVYQNENLASYWHEKYELLDELGVI